MIIYSKLILRKIFSCKGFFKKIFIEYLAKYFWTVLARFAGPVSGIFLLWYSSNGFGLHYTGDLLEFIAHLNIMTALALLGVQHLLMREVGSISDAILTTFYLKYLFKTTATLLVFFTLWFYLYGSDNISISTSAFSLFLIAWMNNFFTLSGSMFIGLRKYLIGQILVFSGTNLMFIILLGAGESILFLVGIILVASVSSLLFKVFSMRQVIRGGRDPYIGDRKEFAIESILSSFQSNIVIALLGALSSASSVTLFAIYSKIASILGLIGSAINSYHTKSMIDAFEAGRVAFDEALRSITKIMLASIILPALLVYIASPLIFDFLNGSGFQYEIILILMLAQLVNVASGPVGVGLNVARKMKRKVYSAFVTFLLSVLLIVIGYVYFEIDLLFMCCVTAISIVFNNILNYYFLLRD